MCQGSSSPTSFMLAGLRMLHVGTSPTPAAASLDRGISIPPTVSPAAATGKVRSSSVSTTSGRRRPRPSWLSRSTPCRTIAYLALQRSGFRSPQKSSPCAAPTPCGCKRPTSPLPSRPWWPTCPTTLRYRCAAPVHGADHAMSALLIVQPGSPTALVAYPGSCIYGMLPRQGLLRRHGHVGAFAARGVFWPVSDVESGAGVH